MTLKKCVPMMLTLTILTSCSFGGPSAEDQALALRESWLQMSSFQSNVSITADYGDRAYQYEAACSGNAEAGEVLVTAPESIAGTGTAWEEGETLLEYDGVWLETGQLSGDGLSPADALPVILAACQSGAILESGLEDWGEEQQALYLLTENPKTNAEESRIAIWADPESGALYQAEIYWANERVIHMTFTDFSMELTPVEETE